MKDMMSGIRILSRLSFPLVLLAVIGCDPSSAKKFDLGRPLPDVRFEVILPNSIHRDELYARVERLAHQDGFSHLTGDHEAKLLETGKPGFKWWQCEPPRAYASILFLLEIDENRLSSKFQIILYNNGLRPLDVHDWIKFGEWRDKFLPEAFPASQIKVLRSPVLNTDPEQLDRIVAESGVSVDAT
jgi:hypothetical protein